MITKAYQKNIKNITKFQSFLNKAKNIPITFGINKIDPNMGKTKSAKPLNNRKLIVPKTSEAPLWKILNCIYMPL